MYLTLRLPPNAADAAVATSSNPSSSTVSKGLRAHSATFNHTMQGLLSSGLSDNYYFPHSVIILHHVRDFTYTRFSVEYSLLLPSLFLSLSIYTYYIAAPFYFSFTKLKLYKLKFITESSF